jgi:CheY-like chemotaxis protein
MKIGKVLLVDDDPAIRMVAEICLTRVGNWSVFLADSGALGLEIAHKEQPDLILLDVMMPGMDGPTMLGLLRQISDIPVIFITAKVHEAEVERYMSLGALGVIAKPFDPMKLPSTILSIVNGQECRVIYDGTKPTSAVDSDRDGHLVPLGQ